MTDVTIFVPEISCDTCKNAIEGALRPLPGVCAADVDVAARQVRVSYDEAAITRDALTAAIAEQGYEVPDGD
ncbi:MAG: heavy-metal-associated domain-containing protein [Actinomycetota bacterium]|nr:heavy-metal-associated domain-containing protein [Actinomycetota bacterium]